MYAISNHAIERFQQRFSRCNGHLAQLLLEAALRESVPAPKSARRKVRQQVPLSDSTEYRYHWESSLFLVIEEGVLVTVYPVVV